jgi:hypothetical protein
MLHLVNSECFPLLLYGLDACPPNKSEKNSLNFTAMRFFMKLFRSSNSDLINQTTFFFGVNSAIVNLQKRTAKFVAKHAGSENKICQMGQQIQEISRYTNLMSYWNLEIINIHKTPTRLSYYRIYVTWAVTKYTIVISTLLLRKFRDEV